MLGTVSVVLLAAPGSADSAFSVAAADRYLIGKEGDSCAAA
eukprot:SAG31_NODE_39184_length_290_cov_0.816754_1_plen_40_part_01